MGWSLRRGVPASEAEAGKDMSDDFSVSAGGSHTCAVLDDATLKCWGYGGSGLLGTGSTSNVGDGPGEMGDSLPIVPLGEKVLSLSQQGQDQPHTCAILQSGRVKCCTLSRTRAPNADAAGL